MSWLGRVTSGILVALLVYALLHLGQDLELRTIVIPAQLILSVAGFNDMHFVPENSGLSLTSPTAAVRINPHFLFVGWPLYAGLCVATAKAARKAPVGLLMGFTALLVSASGALGAVAWRFATQPGTIDRRAAEIVSLLFIGGQRVFPIALWWIQFGAGDLTERPGPARVHRRRHGPAA